MDEVKSELLEDTMLENEQNFSEYAKIFSDYKDKKDAILSIENPDLKARFIADLQQKCIKGFARSLEIGDSALIETYKDILIDLGSDDYIIDNQIDNYNRIIK